MAKRKRALLDDVIAKVQIKRPGFASWFERLPKEMQHELEAIRTKFENGQLNGLNKRAVSTAISQVVRERGYHCCGMQGVLAWLNRQSGSR